MSLYGAVLGLFGFSLATAASAQTFRTLIDFNQTDGEQPLSPVVQGTDGNLYGTTVLGGSSSTIYYNGGTVYQMLPGGTINTLYNFCSRDSSCTDGSEPQGNLLPGRHNDFYGITVSGGAYAAGTVFEITQGGVLTTVYDFCALRNCADGEVPTLLVEGIDGNFYGTTSSGGLFDHGTFFKITPAGALTTLSSLKSGADYPNVGLMRTSDGDFYGTFSGGVGNHGAIIRITPAGKLITVHAFCLQGFPCSDGADPFGTLLQADDGNLYGTTSFGGTDNFGTIFKIDASGTLTTLYNFCPQNNCVDGGNPINGLLQASDGNFYGVTDYGGTGSNPGCDVTCGTIFKITPTGSLTVLHDFCTQGGVTCTDGYDPLIPSPSLMQATNGQIFGTTERGGGKTLCMGSGCGTIFSLSGGLAPFVEAVPNFGKAGRTVSILGNNLTGTTAVSFNDTQATFTVVSDTNILAHVPAGATTGTITVTAPGGALSSLTPFHIVH
jgi:uncharacterized repeat protein (TIGR03803 family)